MDLPALDLQSPNILGSYLQGAQGGQALAMMPYQMQQAQQQAAAGALNLQQLRLALQGQQMRMGFMSNVLGQLTGQGSPSAGRTGGIQNGPQDQVAGSASPAPPPLLAYPGGASTSDSRSATPLTGPTQASGSYDGSMGGAPSVGRPSFDAGQSDLSPTMARAIGALDPDMLKGISESDAYNLRNAQHHAQPYLDMADVAISSPNPERLVMNNPGTYGAAWRQFGAQLGLDVSDPRTMTPENVRAAAVLYRNSIAAQVGLAPTPMPAEVSMVRGPNGQLFGVTHGGTGPQGATTEIVGQKLPTYAMEKAGYDPNSGRELGRMIMTSPGGAPAPSALGQGLGSGMPSPSPAASGGSVASPASTPGGVGGVVGPSIDLGMPSLTNENTKAVGFASSMRQSVSTLRDIEQKSGYTLSPSDRAVMINVASDEDPDLLHQWFSQMVLAHKLSPQAQTYISAAMPAIQSLSHDQSGARLNGSTIRANLESAIPINVKNQANMQQVEAFRNNYYKSMLLGSGPAAYTPAFNDTLGADLRTMQSGGQLPGDLAQVKTDADYAALRPGWRFVGPDGKVRIKPQQ